ncbi:MAG: bacterioferritin [Nitrospinae bacterium]|nr:bacterioferritin [Nitrospinota bacterium]
MDLKKPGREVALLNKILELELAGVVRYTHYSFMVFGMGRIPIIGWLRGQATESLAHADLAGEMITTLGAHPSLAIGPLLETETHVIQAILRESLEHENASLKAYEDLLAVVRDKNVLLEEYARKMVYEEEMHISDVNKMLRKPGDVEAYPL